MEVRLRCTKNVLRTWSHLPEVQTEAQTEYNEKGEVSQAYLFK